MPERYPGTLLGSNVSKIATNRVCVAFLETTDWFKIGLVHADPVTYTIKVL
jgi:hypothetical protein